MKKPFRKAFKNLLSAAEDAAEWIRENKLPNEAVPALRVLEAAIKEARALKEQARSYGNLLLVEQNGLRRITITVESKDRYTSRAGWKKLGVKANVPYAQPVRDLEFAREVLKEQCPDLPFSGAGMRWTDRSREELKAVIDKVAKIVRRRPEQLGLA